MINRRGLLGTACGLFYLACGRNRAGSLREFIPNLLSYAYKVNASIRLEPEHARRSSSATPRPCLARGWMFQ
ncbi:hypothetical protein BCR33DRAFT_822237 [Rhizoclosmatium globosum]|uniref:Uncharacterized protein n=1 Tax=Rhizoclosmatium globosum TaxID=329046 RepID=A0A1Y2A7N6_9FUNG|nr:hypothetical protein BCR33DRAFT_822237 [Rhizoclosmatium globosum]|eukprot:ORY18484.1 hypothetical protein BCR33DRAFT_822237 [Rhizoclosmatium globosum]